MKAARRALLWPALIIALAAVCMALTGLLTGLQIGARL